MERTLRELSDMKAVLAGGAVGERGPAVRVVVTGAGGFVGKNLVTRLQELADIQILPITRSSSIDDLVAAAKQADFVFHLAGVNRPKDPAEFTTGNVVAAQHLCAALSRAGRKAPIVYASSRKAGERNPYGESKAAAEEFAPLSLTRRTIRSRSFVCRTCLGSGADPTTIRRWRLSVITLRTACRSRFTTRMPPSNSSILMILSAVSWRSCGSSRQGLRALQLSRFIGLLWERSPTTSGGSMPSASNSRCLRSARGLQRALYATYLTYLPETRFAYPLKKQRRIRGERSPKF